MSDYYYLEIQGGFIKSFMKVREDGTFRYSLTPDIDDAFKFYYDYSLCLPVTQEFKEYVRDRLSEAISYRSRGKNVVSINNTAKVLRIERTHKTYKWSDGTYRPRDFAILQEIGREEYLKDILFEFEDTGNWASYRSVTNIEHAKKFYYDDAVDDIWMWRIIEESSVPLRQIQFIGFTEDDDIWLKYYRQIEGGRK